MNNTVNVPFSDLSLQWQVIRENALPDIEKLFQSSAFCLGSWVENFEKSVADYLGVKHAIAVNSGTSALHLAAIVSGINPGDKVMVPAQTFAGTVWGILYQGGIPILCDVDEDTATIAIDELERRYETGVKAIIPVHLFGQPANMDAIMTFAARRNLVVIEDGAQAFGARYGSRKLCSLGSLGCVSFYPGKNLGAAGEGGLITTNDDQVASRLRALRSHGQSQRYVHDEIGFNYRMEGVQGLILGHKLPLLDEWTDERRTIARRYGKAFSGLPLALPKIMHGDHVWHLYVVRTPLRDKLRDYLSAQGIETGLHYPVPMHLQPMMSKYNFDPEGYPNALRWANEGLSLPIFVGMTESQQNRVINAVASFFN